jgi:hypothetical protein
VRRGRDVQSSWPSAAEIVVPPTLRTVIINGESDKITTADDARALQARFRSSVCANQRSGSQQAWARKHCLCSQTVGLARYSQPQR